MEVIRQSDYRKNLDSYLRDVVENSDPLYVVGRSGAVVVLPVEEYENKLAKLQLLSKAFEEHYK